MPLCASPKNRRVRVARLIFWSTAAANLLPSSATGGGRSRDPQHAPRVVKRAALAARATKKGHPCGCPFLVAGAVGIEPTTRGFGVDVNHQITI